MLVVVSDMHLTDQTLAPSVPPEALARLTQEIRKLAGETKSLELILLGDIFDLLRSSRWLVKTYGDSLKDAPEDIRPWHSVDSPVEDVVATILLDMQSFYGTFFENLAKIENVKLTWVPGNHDRLVNFTTAGKNFLKTLQVQPADYEMLEKDYGVFARHGHCFDKYNIRKKNYELAPFGDALVIEALDGLHVELARRCRVVHFDHKDVAFLAAMEGVRPHARIPLWLHETTKKLPDELVQERTRDAWRAAVDNFCACEIFKLLSAPERTIFKKLLDASKDFRSSLVQLAALLEQLAEDEDNYAKHAAAEAAAKDDSIKCVVYGHTHVPEKRALASGCYYVNTGWWDRSYELRDHQLTARMNRFFMLVVDKQWREPDFREITLNTPIAWKPPDKKPVPPRVSFADAQKAEANSSKRAILGRGVLNLLSACPGVEVKGLWNPVKKGYDMVVANEIRQATLGRDIAVQVKATLKEPDIDGLAVNLKKSKIDAGWIFTTAKVSDEIKKKAKKSKISVFDARDIKTFSTGKGFASLLRSGD